MSLQAGTSGAYERRGFKFEHVPLPRTPNLTYTPPPPSLHSCPVSLCIEGTRQLRYHWSIAVPSSYFA